MGGKSKSLDEALAILISSTRTKTRPVSLVEVGEWLRVAIDKLGSVAAVADRIGISTKMLRQFLLVETLTPGVKSMFRRKELDSIDAVSQLAMLPGTDQEDVARAMAKEALDTSDVRAVVELRRKEPKASMGSVLRRVRESKTKKEYVVEFVVREGQTTESMVKSLARHLPRDEVVSVETIGSLGRLVLTPAGKAALAVAAKKLQVPLRNVVSRIFHG
jgi:hypothetical protein